jgi:hypothetical protein
MDTTPDSQAGGVQDTLLHGPSSGFAALGAALRGLAPRATSGGCVNPHIGVVRDELVQASSLIQGLSSFLSTISMEQQLALFRRATSLETQVEIGNALDNETTYGCGDYDYFYPAPVADADAPQNVPSPPTAAELETSALFARRHLDSIGLHKLLLLEEGARCDDCSVCVPGVVDYCRKPAGCRLCFKCDALRHELSPCSRERWILVANCSDSGAGATASRVKRRRDTCPITPCYPRLLGLNEFVDAQPSTIVDLSSVASRCKCMCSSACVLMWIRCVLLQHSDVSYAVLPAPICGTAVDRCPSCRSFHCQPESWDSGPDRSTLRVYERGSESLCTSSC